MNVQTQYWVFCVLAGYEDNWNNYANEVGSWNNRGGGGSMAPSSPTPLIPGLKSRRGPIGSGPGSGNNPNMGGYSILMRGLPFRASEEDIRRVSVDSTLIFSCSSCLFNTGAGLCSSLTCIGRTKCQSSQIFRVPNFQPLTKVFPLFSVISFLSECNTEYSIEK